MTHDRRTHHASDVTRGVTRYDQQLGPRISLRPITVSPLGDGRTTVRMTARYVRP